MTPLVDIHAHVLPGVDDGPETLDQSLAMCAIYAEQGVGAVVATPHMADGNYDVQPDEARRAVETLNRECAEAGIDLRVVPGGEVRVAPGLFEKLEAGELLTIGDAGTHVLLELGPGPAPPLAGMMDALTAQGITPVLGHPERHPEFWRRPDPLSEWAELGCLYQVTAASLIGRLGRRPRQLSRAMIDAGMVHAVASDAHRTRGKRRSEMDRAFEWLRQTAGRIAAAQLMIQKPARMAGLLADTAHGHRNAGEANPPAGQERWNI
jgi:protein-tyrosine phosphatase